MTVKPFDILRMGAGHGGGGGGGDPYWPNVTSLLLGLGADGSNVITDEKGLAWTAHGSAQIDTAESIVGGSSILLPGSGDYISRALVAADGFGTGDFTIEMYRRFDSGLREYLYGQNNNDAAIILTPATGILEVYGPASYVINGGATPLALNTWHHLELARSGNNWYFFINGTLYLSATDARSWGSSAGTLTIAQALGANYMTGHVAPFRQTAGVARHTANFTPPTTFPTS